MPRFRRPPERLRGMSFYGLIHCVQPYKRNWYFLEATRWSGKGNLGACADDIVRCAQGNDYRSVYAPPQTDRLKGDGKCCHILWMWQHFPS